MVSPKTTDGCAKGDGGKVRQRSAVPELFETANKYRAHHKSDRVHGGEETQYRHIRMQIIFDQKGQRDGHGAAGGVDETER